MRGHRLQLAPIAAAPNDRVPSRGVTAAWHFADIEIGQPDLQAAYNGFAPLGPEQLASQGPAQACVVSKIDQFAAELRNPATPPNERLLAVEALGSSAEAIAAALDDRTSSEQARRWVASDARAWAMESFQIAQRDAYALAAKPTCAEPGAVALTHDYQATARRDVAVQLEKAGLRMAAMLNQALG